MFRPVSIAMLLASCAAAQTPPARGEWTKEFDYRLSGHAFYSSGGSMGEGGSPGEYKGGGGGFEGFVWKGLSAGADVSVYKETYLQRSQTFGNLAGNAAWHFGSRERRRGIDPFVLFGVGAFFPDEPNAVAHGGGGFTYWFGGHAGVRAEIRVTGRDRDDGIDGYFRVGVAFR